MRTVAATSPRVARRDREHGPIVSAPLEGPSPPAAARPVVLHVAQPTDAGVAFCVAALAGDQVERGWEVAVACPREGSLSPVVADAGARHLGWEARRSPGPSIVDEVRSLRRIVAAVAPDVLHLHSAKAGLAGRLLATWPSRAVVFEPNGWSFHAVAGPVRAATLAWERYAAGRTDVLVCVSEGERADGERVGIRARYRVIPNGVAAPAKAPTEDDRIVARRELGLSPDPLAVCLGRLSRQKGQDVLLRAWPCVRAAVPAAQLALVGDGPDRAALEGVASPGVRFVGASDAAASWLTAADVVAMPSRWEGMSFAMLEALALARPVVIAAVAGADEAVDGDAGAIIPIEDAPRLAAELVARLRDPAHAACEGAAGRRRVLERFTIDRMTAATAELYLELLREPPDAYSSTSRSVLRARS